MCGDVHGQFYDLLRIWELNGLPSPDNPYLFNGGLCVHVGQGAQWHACIWNPGQSNVEHPQPLLPCAPTSHAPHAAPSFCPGDFVDRGSFSVEVILALLAYKVGWSVGGWLV